MPTLSKRIWNLPNGEEHVTWRVEWKEFNHPRYKPFSNFREAVAFLTQLALDLKTRKALARTPTRVDRIVRPRMRSEQVVPVRRRRKTK
jgi:hypothetical protein